MSAHVPVDPERDGSLVRVAYVVERIGVKALWYRPETGEWFVSLRNRTYAHVHAIAPEKLDVWRKKFDLPARIVKS